MNKLFRFDDWLIDHVAQPPVDFCSRHFGLHFITIAEFLLTGAVVAWIAGIFETDILVIRVVTIITGGMFIFFYWTSVTITRRRLKSGFVNSARFSCFIQRMGNLASSPLFFAPPYRITMIIYITLLITGYYVLSCEPGPPRVRQRITALAPAAGSA